MQKSGMDLPAPLSADRQTVGRQTQSFVNYETLFMKNLIIKLGALGDIIFSTSVIKKIVDFHHNEQVFLLTTPEFKSLFENFASLKTFSFKRKGIINTIKTINWIRKQKFSRIYDLQSNDRSSLYCALSGCGYVAGNHPRFPYHVHPSDKYTGECHAFERLNRIIKRAGIDPAAPRPCLPVPDSAEIKITGWLTDNNLIEKSFVIFHAGSSPRQVKKRWPFFAELADRLNDQLQIVWVGGKDDMEINRSLSNHCGINATGQFNLFELIALGKRAKFAVTNDSAPMHILSCSEIPVFGLFGPTCPRRTHALGQFDNVISACDPVAKNDRDFIPYNISEISTDTVLQRLLAKKLI